MPLSIQTRRPATTRIKRSIENGSCSHNASTGSNSHQTLLSESRYAAAAALNMRLRFTLPMNLRAPARGWVCRVFWNGTRYRDIVPVRRRVQGCHLHPQRLHAEDKSLRPPAIASEPYPFSPYVYGEPATEYTSEETAMGPYQSASLLFEQMRILSSATADGAPLDGLNPQNVPATPPHILILGPENSGKTTLCKTLINYAVRGEPWGRGEWSPILVNVDPGDVSSLDALSGCV